MFRLQRPRAATRIAPVFLALVLGTAAADAAEDARIALVIGNGTYVGAPPLRNPPNDARLMARTLRALGFDVVERIDADREAMLIALRDFGDRLERAGEQGVGLFYYAGHGVQVRGLNYIIPTTARIARESDVPIYAVNVADVLGTMAFARSRLNFVVLDACRNNPYARSFRSANRGLARLDAPRGTLIAYATAPGDVAADGSGTHSPYTHALAQALRAPGATAEQAFKQARIDVMAATASRQVPWEASPLTGGFYFGNRQAAVAAEPPAPSAAPAPATGEADLDALFWRSVVDSQDADAYEEYLRRFPSGVFAGLARRRIDALNASKAAPRTAARPPAQAPVLGSGAYKADVWVGTAHYPSTWTLNVNGTEVTGTSEWTCCPTHRIDPLEGSFSGGVLDVERRCDVLFFSCRQRYRGKIEGGTIKGRFTGDGGPGTWVLHLR